MFQGHCTPSTHHTISSKANVYTIPTGILRVKMTQRKLCSRKRFKIEFNVPTFTFDLEINSNTHSLTMGTLSVKKWKALDMRIIQTKINY